jgi:Ca-activated chloride channel family protein
MNMLSFETAGRLLFSMKPRSAKTTVLLFSGVLAAALVVREDILARQSVPNIRVDVDMVLVNVSVTDSLNRFVGGLTQKHFRIFEDRVEQEILTLSHEDAPISLGIIFDRSGSMGAKRPGTRGLAIDNTKLAAFSCLRDGLRDDQYFLIEFSKTPQVTRDFTNDPTRLRENILFVGAGGRTALWDAIYMGVTKMEKGIHPRKALLVLTDGLENNSRYSLGQIKKLLLEQDVRIYSYGANVTFDGLTSLSSATGGGILRANSNCGELRADLRNQYVIGYRSTNRNKDGQFRRISVRINPAAFRKATPDLKVRAKEGYFAAP